MIFVRGKNVFGGYSDPSIPSPFEIRAGVEYYKT